MTVAFTAGNNAVSAAPIDLITSALIEIGVLSPSEQPSPNMAQWGLEKLQRLIDHFNAREELIFSHNFALYSLLANHAPHTFGPTGNFDVPIRPVKVISASFLLNNGVSTFDLPVNIRNDQWWADNPLKSMASSVVTELYYDAASPLGNCNFWPICTGTNQVRLETWNSLAQAIDENTKLGFVQGYWEAIILSLAVSLTPAFPGIEVSPILLRNEQRAMQAIIGNNNDPPRIDTSSGMPGARNSGRPDFNFLTGLRE